MAKKSDAGTGVLLIFGAVIAGLAAAYEWAKNNLLLVGIAVGVLVIGGILSSYSASERRKARFRELIARFGSEEVADDIMNRRFRTGWSEEMLRASLGEPDAVDEQRLKTKRKEVWKYGERRKNQFALRITIENGRVVGWDQKS
jgi:sulfite reductase beta subunit-like hemoprotein